MVKKKEICLCYITLNPRRIKSFSYSKIIAFSCGLSKIFVCDFSIPISAEYLVSSSSRTFKRLLGEEFTKPKPHNGINSQKKKNSLSFSPSSLSCLSVSSLLPLSFPSSFNRSTNVY